MPQPPEFNKDWTLERYQQEMVLFHRQLVEYIRRLLGSFTAKNIITEIIVGSGLTSGQVADFQYDEATHQLQVKRIDATGKVSGWTMITGGQAVEDDT